MKDIWSQDQAYFTDCFRFSRLTPQTPIFGLHNNDNDTFLIQDHILLMPENTDFYLLIIFSIKLVKPKV